MKLPVLEYLVNANYIDYLAAFLNAAPFSRGKVTVERRDRIAGSSKFGFFGHAYTAVVIMSYHYQLLVKLHRISYIMMIVLGIVAIVTTSYVAIVILALFVIITQIWNGLLSEILAKRSMPSHFVAKDTVEQVLGSKNSVVR